MVDDTNQKEEEEANRIAYIHTLENERSVFILVVWWFPILRQILSPFARFPKAITIYSTVW